MLPENRSSMLAFSSFTAPDDSVKHGETSGNRDYVRGLPEGFVEWRR